MLVRVFLILVLLSIPALAGIGVVATQTQLNNLCVQVKLNIDNDYHWFYYKTILAFDQSGMTIKQKQGTMFFPRTSILNFDEAIDKWHLLESLKP